MPNGTKPLRISLRSRQQAPSCEARVVRQGRIGLFCLAQQAIATLALARSPRFLDSMFAPL